MAVAKSKKSRMRRDMKRAHIRAVDPTLSTDQETGETHLRHHITKDGYYRGKQVLKQKDQSEEETVEE